MAEVLEDMNGLQLPPWSSFCPSVSRLRTVGVRPAAFWCWVAFEANLPVQEETRSTIRLPASVDRIGTPPSFARSPFPYWLSGPTPEHIYIIALYRKSSYTHSTIIWKAEHKIWNSKHARSIYNNRTFFQLNMVETVSSHTTGTYWTS